jgi:hypothetical protein
MSSRPLLAPNSVLPLVNAVSTGANITSPVTIIQMLPGISYDIAWTGTTNGTIDVQVSNTYRQNADGTVAVAGNWTTLPHASFAGTYPTPAGSPGSGFLDVVGTEAYAVRLVFTRASGSGTMTIVPCGKVL